MKKFSHYVNLKKTIKIDRIFEMIKITKLKKLENIKILNKRELSHVK